jgi:hypothetical protein
MPQLHSDYFLSLAQVSLAFVACSTIAVVLRHMLGKPLDPYQTLLVRFIIECGFAATMFALAAVVLAVANVEAGTLWRVASAALGVFCLLYLFHYLHRRRRATTRPLHAIAWFIIPTTLVIDVALWTNALTPILHWSAWPYAVGATWVILQAALVFLLTLRDFLKTGAE